MAHITFERRDPQTGYPHPEIPHSIRRATSPSSSLARPNSERSNAPLFIPRRPPLKSAGIKQGFSDIGALSLAVLFLCSVAIGFPIAIYMLLFGSF